MRSGSRSVLLEWGYEGKIHPTLSINDIPDFVSKSFQCCELISMKLFWMTHQDKYIFTRAQSFWMTSSSWLMCISPSLCPSRSVHLLERSEMKVRTIQSKEIKLKEENAVHNCCGHYRWDAVVVYLLCTLSTPPVALLTKGDLVLVCVMFEFLLENFRPSRAREQSFSSGCQSSSPSYISSIGLDNPAWPVSWGHSLHPQVP